MEILFYVLCITFFLSLFILKFKWFKKIGQWLAKPFVAIMKRKRNAKNSARTKDDAGNRAKISQMQLRPVVLPPQLNAPKKEEKQEEQKAAVAEEKKPVTMKEAFGGKNPFATRPVFPMAQIDYEKQTQSLQSPFGTKFAQNLPNVQPKVQNRASLDFLNAERKSNASVNQMLNNGGINMSQMLNGGDMKLGQVLNGGTGVGQKTSKATFSASPFMPMQRDVFAMPRESGRNLERGSLLSEKPGQNRFNFDKEVGQNTPNFNSKFGQNSFASGGVSGRNLTFSNGRKGQDLSFLTAGKSGAANVKFGNFADKSAKDMDAIIAKRKREFDDYKRQKDSMEIDGQDVDIAGLPPKLKRILVMGILDQKKYD